MKKIIIIFLILANIVHTQANAYSKILTNLSDKNSALYAYQGDVFTAVKVPANIQLKIKNLQNQISNCLGKKNFSPSDLNNLHITLKIIGAFKNPSYFKKIHAILASVTKRHKGWNLAKHMKNIRLSISKDGLVKLILPRSDTLSALAADIRASLHKAKKDYSKRFDFPDNAHITIGKINTKNIDGVKKTIKNCFSSGKINIKKTLASKHFHVTNFLLLKPNRPQPIRKYAPLSVYNF